jgi:hypothetical protein
VIHLDGAWAEVLGWALVLAGLTIFSSLIVIAERRRARRFYVPEMPPRLDRGREWDMVMQRASKELARGPRVEELQADAAVTIQSAEYAYNRLVLDCAQHCTVRAPALEPVVEPVLEPTVTAPPPQPTPTPAEEPAPLAA